MSVPTLFGGCHGCFLLLFFLFFIISGGGSFFLCARVFHTECSRSLMGTCCVFETWWYSDRRTPVIATLYPPLPPPPSPRLSPGGICVDLLPSVCARECRVHFLVSRWRRGCLRTCVGGRHLKDPVAAPQQDCQSVLCVHLFFCVRKLRKKTYHLICFEKCREICGQ